jgi:hypothetical protein
VTAGRIDLLIATPKSLAHLVAEASDAQLDQAPTGGGWSARTVLAHLRDFEFLQARPALERALAEERPAVAQLDNRLWERDRNRTRDRKEWLLAEFALQRQASASILRALRPADWRRELVSPFAGLLTTSALLDWWLEHDAIHLVQLEAAIGETLADVLARRARIRDA